MLVRLHISIYLPFTFLSAGKHTLTRSLRYVITVIAGFFTGGALAVRGGVKSARNSAIGCAILLAVIEGVGIGLGRMMAQPPPPMQQSVSRFLLMSPSHIFLWRGAKLLKMNRY